MNTIVASRYVGQPTDEQRTSGQSAGGGPATRYGRRVARSRVGRLTLPLLAGALVVAGAAGCSSKDRAPASSAGQPAASSSAGLGAVPTASAVDPGTSPEATSAGQPGKPLPTPTGKAPGAASSPVKIVQFRIAQKPTCPQGTSEFPVEATPLVIEWKVTGADQVELAVDGPGLYDTYPAQSKETFTFSCGGTPGSIEKHTYKITAKHGSYVETRTVTATATVYDKAEV
ncbi:hypothetical protein OG792_32450 [Micromonospora sp. NBC_01699]|uniref:hypothetical protein n=1 Tax=Micromonospora sp. NBC_01699 TaxID=2975984 RepID=UPI002E293BD6|nr:hypothetical protein [Micromonospora sp. NBC_01699]